MCDGAAYDVLVVGSLWELGWIDYLTASIRDIIPPPPWNDRAVNHIELADHLQTNNTVSSIVKTIYFLFILL